MSENREDPPESPIPTADEVISDIVGSQSGDPSSVSMYEEQYLDDFLISSVESDTKYAHLQGIRDHYSHKGKWSKFLMFAVGGMIAFQFALLFFVGLGVLDFTKYEWLLPALLVQNLGQVIGLAVYAVKYLFSDISGQTPK